MEWNTFCLQTNVSFILWNLRESRYSPNFYWLGKRFFKLSFLLFYFYSFLCIARKYFSFIWSYDDCLLIHHTSSHTSRFVHLVLWSSTFVCDGRQLSQTNWKADVCTYPLQTTRTQDLFGGGADESIAYYVSSLSEFEGWEWESRPKLTLLFTFSRE